MTGLNTKTEAQNALVTTTNEHLETIITLLGTEPPSEPVTIGDLLDVLVTIQENTYATLQASLAIRDSLRDLSNADIEDDHESIAGLIFRIRKAVAPTEIAEATLTIQAGVSAIGNILTSLLAIGNTHLGNIYSVLSNGLSNIGLNVSSSSYSYQGWLESVDNWLARTSGGIGVPIDSGTNENVIELLARIANKPEAPVNQGSVPPNLCTDAYISSGMVLVPGLIEPIWPTMVFAQWPATNAYGIDFGTVFGISEDDTELEIPAGTGWFGYGLYVASSANNFGTYIGASDDGTQRYPTNVWIDISSITTNLSVYVGGTDSVRAYLCQSGWGGGSGSGGPWGDDYPGTWTQCVSIGSKYAVLTEPNGFNVACWHAAMAQLPGNAWGSILNIPEVENPLTGSDSDWFWFGDPFGFIVKLDTGDRIRIAVMDEDGDFSVWHLDTIGSTREIDVHGVVLFIDTRENDLETENTEFSVTICPNP